MFGENVFGYFPFAKGKPPGRLRIWHCKNACKRRALGWHISFLLSNLQPPVRCSWPHPEQTFKFGAALLKHEYGSGVEHVRALLPHRT